MQFDLRTRAMTLTVTMTVTACALTALSLMSGSAQAQTPSDTTLRQVAPSWTVGLDLGATRETFGCDDTVRCDRSGQSSRLTFGRRLGDHFSVQASLIASRGTGAEVDVGLARVARGTLKSQGFELAAMLHSPRVGGLSGYAKLGLASMSTRGTLDVPGLASQAMSQRHTTPVLGLGVLVALTPQLNLHAGADWRRLSLDGDKHHQSAFLLGAQLSF
jgi:Outer membrane protein beta-barrel domain